MKMWYSLLQATFLFGAVRSSEFVNSLGCASEVTDTDYEENLPTNDYPGSLRAVFIPPSKMQVSWEEYISYPFEELNLCLDDSCIPLLGFEGFHVFEDIQEQPSYEVFVCGNTTDLVVVNVTVITPWQLAVSTTGSTHISATWSDSEAVVEVCLSGTKLTCQNISDRNMASFHDLIPNTSYILFLRSANDLYYRELVVKTAVEESYRSLSWTCQNETVCHGLECIPSLDTLVPGVGEDEIPKSYAFSCQSPYSVCEEDCAEPIQETTLQTNQSEIFIHFADFSTVSKEASCKLESSLPLFRYWCQGKQQCRIVHSITHSYFTEENNCQETDVKKFETHTKYSNESDFHCIDGTTFYEPHITCYKKVPDNHFSNARKECLSIGGDVAYVVEDEDELDFMKFLKNLTGGTSWIMGVASEPRPVKVRMDSPMYAMLEESNITQCYQENCPQKLPAACALPPVGNSPSQRLPTNIAFPKCDPNPCQNGGTCFLFASSLSPEDFEYNEEVCNCTEHFQGRFCDEKSEDSNTMNSVGLSNGTYEFSSPPNMTMVFEYAFFGQYPDENILDPRDTDEASTASADKRSMSELTKEKMKERDAINSHPPSKNLDKFSGCYAPSALALLKLRCDGRAQCQVSLRDLKEHLLSSCHPVVSPKLYVRVSHHLQVNGNVLCQGLSWRTFCFGVSSVKHSSASEAKSFCNHLGGDLVSSKKPGEEICEILQQLRTPWIEETLSVWYESSHEFPGKFLFSPFVESPILSNCTPSRKIDGSYPALCLLPLTVNLTTDTPNHTTTESPSETETETETEEPSTPEPTEESTTAPHNTTPTETTHWVITDPIPNTTTTDSIHVTSTIHPVPDCPTAVPFPDLYPDFEWDHQLPSKISIRPCPQQMRGNASWACGGDGEWIGLPDMSACKSIDASAWIDELDKSNATAGAILQEFTDNSTTPLAAGDVSEVLNLLDVAAKRHVRDIQNASDPEQSTELSLNYTKGITSTANYMLQEPKVWHGIPNSDRRESVSTLQAIVREAGIESAQQLKNNSQLFTFDALSVKIEQHPSSYYDAVSEEGRTLRHPKFEDATLKLPKGFQGEQEIASVTFMAFNNLHCVLNEKLPCVPDGKEVLGRTFQQQTNSPIMGAAVSNTSWQASPPDKPVVVTFPYIYGANVYNLTNLTCVFWNEEENDWSTEGCDLVTKDQEVVVCECDHLTNLAVIMDLNGVLSEEVLVITGWITVIGCSISIVCLTICVIVFELVKHKGNLSSSKYTIDIHLNLCWCLLIVEITMLAGLDSQDPTGCQCTAVLLHYFFLATFCWCAVEGCNMYLLLVSVFHTFTVSRRHYYLIGYGLPLILVCITAASTSGYGYRTQPFCWLESSNGAVWAFGVPLILILLMNSVILGLGLKAIIARPMKDYRTDSESSRPRDFTSRKSIVLLTLKLVTILGLTWVLGFSYLIAQTEALAIVFTTFNSLQGVFLLVFLVLTNDKIRKEMRRIILRLPPTDPYSSGNQRPTGTGSTGLDSGTFAVQIPQGVRINPRRSNELDYAACKSQLELEDLGRRRTGSRF